MAVKSADWLNAIPAALLLEQDDRIVFANTAAADLTGYSAGDLAGMRAADVLEPIGAGALVAHCKCKSGSPIAVTLTRAAVDHDGQPAQLITLQPTNVEQRARRHRSKASSASICSNASATTAATSPT